VPSAQRMNEAGQAKTGVLGCPAATHRRSTASNAGVVPVQRLASACTYVLKAAADEEHAAIDV
jgi:hypothetical protein